MAKFLLFCILLVRCWPIALLALVGSQLEVRGVRGVAKRPRQVRSARDRGTPGRG